MNAIELLKTDHRTVRKMLDELADTTERAAKSRGQLLGRIARELRAHGAIEEQIFYPALQESARKEGDKDVLRQVAEAYEEHRAAVQLVLADLEATDAASIQFSGRAKVLKDLVEHHADEEEKEMFKGAKRLLDKAELAALGEEMAALKERELARSGPVKGTAKAPGALAGKSSAKTSASSASAAARAPRRRGEAQVAGGT